MPRLFPFVEMRGQLYSCKQDEEAKYLNNKSGCTPEGQSEPGSSKDQNSFAAQSTVLSSHLWQDWSR